MPENSGSDNSCTHPSLDGLAGTDILLCMACLRLVKRYEIVPNNLPLVGYHELNGIEVKAVFRALEQRHDAEIAYIKHDANSALSQAEGRI